MASTQQARTRLLQDILRLLMGAAASKLAADPLIGSLSLPPPVPSLSPVVPTAAQQQQQTEGERDLAPGAVRGSLELRVRRPAFSQVEDIRQPEAPAAGPASVRSSGVSLASIRDELAALRESTDSETAQQVQQVAEGLADWLTDGILSRVLVEVQQRKQALATPSRQQQPSQQDVSDLRAEATEALAQEIARMVSQHEPGSREQDALLTSIRSSVESARRRVPVLLLTNCPAHGSRTNPTARAGRWTWGLTRGRSAWTRAWATPWGAT